MSSTLSIFFATRFLLWVCEYSCQSCLRQTISFRQFLNIWFSYSSRLNLANFSNFPKMSSQFYDGNGVISFDVFPLPKTALQKCSIEQMSRKFLPPHHQGMAYSFKRIKINPIQAFKRVQQRTQRPPNKLPEVKKAVQYIQFVGNDE